MYDIIYCSKYSSAAVVKQKKEMGPIIKEIIRSYPLPVSSVLIFHLS